VSFSEQHRRAFRFICLPWFSMFMVASLIVAAAFTGTHAHMISEDVRGWAGFAAGHLWSFTWHRAIISVFFTAGGWRFWASLTMLAACVTALELRTGTLHTALTFWLAHLATLLFVSLLIALPLYTMSHPLGQSLVDTGDVGPSAGYYGCLGAFVTTLRSRPWRWGLAGTILIVLGVQCAFSLGDSAAHATVAHSAIAHLVAFPIGLVILGPLLPARRAQPADGGRMRQ
jgi:hypothetical protein